MGPFTLKWNQEMAEQNHKFYDDHIITSRCPPAKCVSGGSGSGGRRTTGEQLVSDHNNDESE